MQFFTKPNKYPFTLCEENIANVPTWQGTNIQDELLKVSADVTGSPGRRQAGSILLSSLGKGTQELRLHRGAVLRVCRPDHKYFLFLS